jgi:RNA polymerase sigma-70 factor (ECF subfamily)
MIKGEENTKTKVVDEKFIEQLCKTTWEPIYRYVYFKVQNREEAEDITQETYYKAISYLQKNNLNINTCIGFLKTVSLNVIRDKWRKNKRLGIALNIDDVRQEETSINDCTEEFAQQDTIENALKLLNEEQRTVIELRILKGYSVADTAKQMEKNEGSIRVLQHRALQKLTKILKGEY